MGAPQGSGGGYGGQQSPYGVGSGGFATASNGGAGYYLPGSQYGGSPQSTYGMPQQPAYGMGTGGQYSPQLRQAQSAWQQQAAAAPPSSVDAMQSNNPYNNNIQGNPVLQMMMQSQRQPYGMGAQGMGNAYGYGGQQGNPWAQTQSSMSMSPDQVTAIDRMSQARLAGQQQPYMPMTNSSLIQPAQGSTSLAPPAAPPMSQAQPPMQAPAPPPPPAPRPPAAAPTRANYSPSNPYGGLYANPQADAWEQQQRSGGLPPPVAPQTDMMRKALSGVDNGYGYGTPGGYQLDTAPSTLDPGSMTGLLGFLGGNVGGRTWQGQAADYANWYRNTYGAQAPGGPTAYPF